MNETGFACLLWQAADLGGPGTCSATPMCQRGRLGVHCAPHGTKTLQSIGQIAGQIADQVAG